MTHTPILIDLIGTTTPMERQNATPPLDEQQRSELYCVINFLNRTGTDLGDVAIQLQESPDAIVYNKANNTCEAYELALVFGSGMNKEKEMPKWRIKRSLFSSIQSLLSSSGVTCNVSIAFRDDADFACRVDVVKFIQDNNSEISNEVFQAVTSALNGNTGSGTIPASSLRFSGAIIMWVTWMKTRQLLVDESFSGWELPIDSSETLRVKSNKEKKASSYVNMMMNYRDQQIEATTVNLLLYSVHDQAIGVIDADTVHSLSSSLSGGTAFGSIYIMPAWSPIVKLA